MRDTLSTPLPPSSAHAMVRVRRPQAAAPDHAAARLRAATRHYEQHVIAWYALGRRSEAHAARDAIVRLRRTRDGVG